MGKEFQKTALPTLFYFASVKALNSIPWYGSRGGSCHISSDSSTGHSWIGLKHGIWPGIERMIEAGVHILLVFLHKKLETNRRED